MSKPEAYIIGAGLSGLSAAVALTAAGYKTKVYESSVQAGGRCRSFWDDEIGAYIDNGNHLILGANKSVFAFLKVIGNEGGLIAQEKSLYPFIDIKSGKYWNIHLNKGKIPWWIFSPKRRVPDSTWVNYLTILRLAIASRKSTVKDCLGQNSIMSERLWDPICKAVLNIEIESASARLLWPVIKLTFGGGAEGSKPYFTREGLSKALIEPAIEFIEKNNGQIKYGHRLREIIFSGKKAVSLNFGEHSIKINKKNQVIVAVPPQIASQMLPGIKAPNETRAILNAHYKLSQRIKLPCESRILGLVGGTADWIFVRNKILSVTVSAADQLIDQNSDLLANKLWEDVSLALGLSKTKIPKYRIVKEKRATFAQDPIAATISRHGAKTPWKNVTLAGDWTNTGLPATIEGAVRSGLTAAIRARKKM